MKEKFKMYKFSLLTLISFIAFIIIYIVETVQFSKYSALMKVNATSYVEEFSMRPILVIIPILSIVFYMLNRKENRSIIKVINYFLIFPVSALIIFYIVAFMVPMGLYFGVLFAIIIGIVRLVVTLLNREKIEEYMLSENDIPELDDGIKEIDKKPGDFVLGLIYRKNVDEDGFVPEDEDAYIASQKKAILPLGDRFVHIIVLGVTGSGRELKFVCCS